MADRDLAPSEELSPIGKAVDAVLFGPFELCARAIDHVPDVAIRVRDQLLFARFIGRLAVQQGTVEIRRRIHPDETSTEDDPQAGRAMSAQGPRKSMSRRAPGRGGAGGTRGGKSASPRRTGDAESNGNTLSTKKLGAVSRGRPNRGDSSDVDTDIDAAAEASPVIGEYPSTGDLALPDYDHLPAVDIVGMLANLTTEERELIETYESTHRARRTVLGKLAQLRAT